MATEPGIQSHQQMRQIVSFDGMVWERNIRPTDIDGDIDFGGRFRIMVELKYDEKEMDTGQRLSFERASDNSRVPFYVILGRHTTPPPEIIMMRTCRAVRVYYDKKWHEVTKPMTVFDAISKIRERHGIPKTMMEATNDFNDEKYGPLPEERRL